MPEKSPAKQVFTYMKFYQVAVSKTNTMQLTDNEIKEHLVRKEIPAKHILEAVEIVKMRMQIKDCSLEEAVEYLMIWIKRAQSKP